MAGSLLMPLVRLRSSSAFFPAAAAAAAVLATPFGGDAGVDVEAVLGAGVGGETEDEGLLTSAMTDDDG